MGAINIHFSVYFLQLRIQSKQLEQQHGGALKQHLHCTGVMFPWKLARGLALSFTYCLCATFLHQLFCLFLSFISVSVYSPPLKTEPSSSSLSYSFLPLSFHWPFSSSSPLNAPGFTCQDSMLCCIRSPPSVFMPPTFNLFRLQTKTIQWTHCAHGFEPLSSPRLACLENNPQCWFWIEHWAWLQ